LYGLVEAIVSKSWGTGEKLMFPIEIARAIERAHGIGE